ncbi:MAG: hypothetical protein AWU59_1465 [Methanolobus sp. T82-4]|nr:MAG: hypothetical protein AWU59_1465 [Methanolobus sp. T82-4]
MDNEVIYHYCSMESFFGIITTKNIRLSNAYKTNDSAELEWIFSIMNKSMSKEFDNEFINLLRNSYNAWLEMHFRPHIACFSKDGDLLSQWRAYSNNGKGVSIGFNRKYFEAIKMLDNKEFQISDVVYDYKEQEELLRNLFSSIGYENLNKIKEIYLKRGATRSLDETILVSALLKFGMKFKNETFSEEKEVRLIHGFDEIVAEPDIFEHRVTSDDLISFVEIPIDLESDYLPIKEIILGPNCKVNPKSIHHFLERNLFVKSIGIDIKKSSSSYRY